MLDKFEEHVGGEKVQRVDKKSLAVIGMYSLVDIYIDQPLFQKCLKRLMFDVLML